MKAIRTSTLILLLILAAAATEGDTAGLGDFKSPAARNAADTYTAALTRLTRDYKEKSDIARKACINQLTIAQQSATKAGNLDEAIRIRDAIAKLNADAPEPAAAHGGELIADREKLSQQLANSTWQSGEAKLKFNEDGTGIYVGSTNQPWSWVAVNGHETYLRFNSGYTIRLEFDEALKTFAYLECGAGTRKEPQAGKRVQ